MIILKLTGALAEDRSCLKAAPFLMELNEQVEEQVIKSLCRISNKWGD